MASSDRWCYDDRKFNFITGKEVQVPAFLYEEGRIHGDPTWRYREADGWRMYKARWMLSSKKKQLLDEMLEILEEEGLEDCHSEEFVIRSLGFREWDLEKTFQSLEFVCKYYKEHQFSSVENFENNRELFY